MARQPRAGPVLSGGPRARDGLRQGPAAGRILLSITRSNVVIKRTETSAMVWVTDLQSGQPVPRCAGDAAHAGDAGRGKGERGRRTATASLTAAFDELDMWTGLFALVERDGDVGRRADVGYTRWEEGITPWEYGLPDALL